MAPRHTTLELTRGNCNSQFLGFQEEDKLEVEIPGHGVRIQYSRTWSTHSVLHVLDCLLKLLRVQSRVTPARS